MGCYFIDIQFFSCHLNKLFLSMDEHIDVDSYAIFWDPILSQCFWLLACVHIQKCGFACFSVFLWCGCIYKCFWTCIPFVFYFHMLCFNWNYYMLGGSLRGIFSLTLTGELILLLYQCRLLMLLDLCIWGMLCLWPLRFSLFIMDFCYYFSACICIFMDVDVLSCASKCVLWSFQMTKASYTKLMQAWMMHPVYLSL